MRVIVRCFPYNGYQSQVGSKFTDRAMADEGKVKIKMFNGSNFAFWKMQIEDVLYQKDLYLPLKETKPASTSDED